MGRLDKRRAAVANTFLAGNLTADPEHRSSEGAKPSVAFTVAVNRRRQINGKWEDASSSFHRCVVWAEQAQRVLADLHKGDRVIVIGELRTHTYKDTEGKPHTSTVVSVEEAGRPCASSMPPWATAATPPTRRSGTTWPN